MSPANLNASSAEIFMLAVCPCISLLAAITAGLFGEGSVQKCVWGIMPLLVFNIIQLIVAFSLKGQ